MSAELFPAYTVADMRLDLRGVRDALEKFEANNWNPRTIAEYKACAAELEALIAAGVDL